MFFKKNDIVAASYILCAFIVLCVVLLVYACVYFLLFVCSGFGVFCHPSLLLETLSLVTRNRLCNGCPFKHLVF